VPARFDAPPQDDHTDPQMRPLLHPTLVNGRSGDPALYVETLFERRAILFDLGDISALPPRKIQRLDHIFVSHAHIDHFFGFDYLLRVLVGRDKTISLCGPAGFTSHVQHKLHAYCWNLAGRYPCDLVIDVTEVDRDDDSKQSHAALAAHNARFRLKTGFAAEELGKASLEAGIVHRESTFQVSAAVLDHRTPSLGFALEEATHLNVWKNRLAEMGLPVGAWLRELKRAVIESRPDDAPIRIPSSPEGDEQVLPLGRLREAVTITPGQKIAYVTDVADTPANRAAIVALARGADLLFIEAAFAASDAALASARAHLTTTAAGQIARAAGVRRVEPFHFSPRYAGEDARMLSEVVAAFTGQAS
jgi:ribonuclease Z